MGRSSALIAVFIIVLLVTMTAWRIDATEEVSTAKNNVYSDQIPFEYDNIRLPGNVVPLKYSLYLHPNITDGKFLYTGSVSIELEVKEETDSIILHSLGLSHIVTTVAELPNYEDLSATRNNGKEIVVKGTTWNKKHEQAFVHLGSKLTKDMKYMLTIYFSGELTAALRGFYRSTYTTKSGEKRYLATTHFEPTGARLAFPCFDEPAMKAKFKISIVREKIHTALSNMPVEKTVHRQDGLIVDNFQESVKMSTYLVAFVVSDFVSLGATSKRGIKIKVWAPKDQISQAKYAIEIAPKILDCYEKFFNVNFPLPKQDLIAIPDFTAGAMENWGLIVYRLTALLYDENESSSSDKQRVASVIAHEMAHQWFGNLVTMKWWNDLWLNEGFAAFVQYIGTDHVSPDWKMMDQFLTSSLHTALARDSHLQSHPILVPVKDPAEIGAIFDTITYLKGSSVIRMMSDFIGHDNFVHGLTNYLQTYKYGNAVSDDLWRTLSKETGHPGINVKTVMDTWTLHMGYPVINVQRIGGQANLTQERFVTDAKNPNVTTVGYKWNIPLTFYYQKARDKKRRWFHVLQKNVIIPWSHSLGWIKLNVDQVGFYRVNYDEQNWKALAMQLKLDHKALSAADRASLIDDAFQLANIGKMTPTQALDLTEYLNKEKEYVPFSTAISALGYIGDMLASRPGYAVYEKYILQQILPRVKTLGWNDVGSHLNKYIRGIVLKLAVHHNNNDAVKKAKDMFKDWMVNGKKMPANLRPIIYYAGIKYGGEKEWNFMYHKYQKCLYPAEKKLLMNSLTFTSNPGLLKRYLELTLNNDVIREADAIFVMIQIAQNPIGTNMLYAFLKEKWNLLIKKYHKEFTNLARLIKAAFGGGKTKEDLHKAKEFFTTHNMDSAKLASEVALASIRNHIIWLETNEKSVVKWFNTKVKK